jgi:Tfp pilus assembly protein FimT
MTSVAHFDRRPRPTNGFTTVELALTLCVILVVAAIAIPSFMSAYRMYQLSDAATQVTGVLGATRLEAIRRNTPVNCIIQQAAGVTRIWTDSIVNSTEDPGERQIIFTGAVNLVDSGSVPGIGNLTAAVGVQTLTAVPLANAPINFDQRGAVNPAAVSALYIGNTSATGAGYRAVILFPSGSIQIWQADGQGNWRFLK